MRAVLPLSPEVIQIEAVIPRQVTLVDLGVEFLQGATFPFSGLKGDLIRAGAVETIVGFEPNFLLKIVFVLFANFMSELFKIFFYFYNIRLCVNPH